MRKLVLVAAVVSAVAVIGWVAYATTSGVDAVTAASVNAQVCPVPVCDAATEDCPPAVSCHDDRTACPPSCKDCPDFKDSDGDGVCDVVGDCGRHGRGNGKQECVPKDAGRCGGRMGRGRGWHDSR